MLTATPHPYQEDAIDAMVSQGFMLLAYETGLGKTVVSVAAVEELIGEGKVNTTMVVALPNLKYQWAQQIAKLTDVTTREVEVKAKGRSQTIVVPTENYCISVTGTPKQRAEQYRRIAELRPDYVILGYNTVVDDWKEVRRIKPDAIILDEITAIKTFRAQRTRKIKRLTAPYRFGLTATPIDNGKPEEIYSIMEWLEPTLLGRFDLFDKTYILRNRWGGVERYKNLPVLHRKLKPVIVRKTSLDPDVAPYMPKVARDKVYVTADTKTKRAYKIIVGDLLEALQKARASGTFDVAALYGGYESPNESTEQGQIAARLMALEMLLDHPDLIVQSGMNYQFAEEQKALGVEKKNWTGSKYCYTLWQSGALDDVTSAPKLDALVEEVTTALAVNEANKIIVFSVHPDMLEIIAAQLPEDVSVLYHGKMNEAEKASSVARFTQDPTCRVFLSSHAGSHGTDLYMANYLFNYDHAQGSGKQTQIDGRHKRAASEFEHIYIRDMLVEGSVEEWSYDRRNLKNRVESAIIDGVGADGRGRIDNDLMSLTEYLRTASL